MKPYSIPLSLSVVVLLAACSSKPEPKLLAQSTQPNAPVELASSSNLQSDQIPAQNFVMSGLINSLGNQYTISPCFTETQFWLDLPPQALSKIKKLDLEKGDQVYAEFSGHLNTVPSKGAAADYPARFVTKSIQTLSKEETQCPEQPAEDINIKWVGDYQSEIAFGLITHVILKPDHTAITRYDYQNGDPSLTETGFWQQVNDSTINVFMTKHEGEGFSAQRLFKVNGKTLTATTETINGTSYDLGNSGLVVQKTQ
ncbi:MAG: hypothetical protein ACK5NC_10350 [Vibrio sp.]